MAAMDSQAALHQNRVYYEETERGRETQLVSLTKMSSRYTPLQGQYLAFIYYYTRIHGRAPAEHDMQAYQCLTAFGPSWF